MLERFKEFIHQEQLMSKQDHVLVTVSGGLDSVVLCDLFFRAGYYFTIAHCNFQLRGAESEEDEAFVRQLGKKYKVPVLVEKFAVAEYIAKHQVSTQMAARSLRYDWFNTLLISENIPLIATAHHLNDSLETVLLNLSKGTGIAGLHGIRSKQGNLIRPLLFASRKEIKQYAEEQNLLWREDSSNASTKYQRNLIRHEVVPVLHQINPNLEKTFATTVQRLSSLENFFLAQVARISDTCMKLEKTNWVIDYRTLSKETSFEIVLLELLRPFGFAWEDVQQLITASTNGSKRFYTSEYYALKYQDSIRIIRIAEQLNNNESIIEEGDAAFANNAIRLSFELVDVQDLVLEKNPTTAYLDYEKLQFPLTVRLWQEGDVFHPFGMKGKKKKISNFLIDEKVPLDIKKSTHVLVSNQRIVWVIGMRTDDTLRITSTTKKVLKINVQTLKQQ